jgi:uncharacterized repeat protein (TIGR03803 family)
VIDPTHLQLGVGSTTVELKEVMNVFAPSSQHNCRPSIAIVAVTLAGLMAVSNTASGQLHDFAVVHSFLPARAMHPNTGLVQATDGNFYGTTNQGGGPGNLGAFFKVSPSGTLTILHPFTSRDGGGSATGLIQADDGNFYGSTAVTIFRMTATGTLTVLHRFVGGATVLGNLFQATDGNLYGMTSCYEMFEPPGYTIHEPGTVFQITTSGGPTVLHTFNPDGADGDCPVAGLIQATDGFLYGTTTTGAGPSRSGAAFRVSTSGTLTVLHAFDFGAEGGGAPGKNHVAAALIQATDGNLYGTSVTDGTASSYGTVFQLTTSGTVTALHAFDAQSGGTSLGGLVQAVDGNLYGTTLNGGASRFGTVFQITTAGSFTVAHEFGGGSDGRYPDELATLVQGSDGDLWGTTGWGGTFNKGTIFKTTLTGAEAVVLSFGEGNEGQSPNSALVQSSDGSLFGTTYTGGSDDCQCGTVFKLTPAGTFTSLLNLSHPYGALTRATDANLYGTTWPADSSPQFPGGVAFQMTPSGIMTVLHQFPLSTVASSEGGPGSALIQAADGNLYGTTLAGGPLGGGTVFKLTTTGTLTVLHAFDPSSEGSESRALIQASDGNFYGTTIRGGPSGSGTIFKLTTTGASTVLHVFSAATNGYLASPLMQATDGNLYGTTITGGPSGVGTVFRITLAGMFEVLHAFAGSDGGQPYSGLIQATDGNLYGTTSIGGSHHYGTVFQITLNGALTVIHAFTGGVDGATPFTGLMQGADGLLYGAAFAGGANGNNAGVIFRIGLPIVAARGDYDRDGAADPAVYRPSTGEWWLLYSSTNYMTNSGPVTWGGGSGIVVPGDYDGDGRTDPAVYFPSTGQWWILYSSTNFATNSGPISWGGGDAIPVPGDYDGDGKTDPAVYFPSTHRWWILYSSTNYTTNSGPVWWGDGDAIPVPGDYDGDGKMDPAVYFPSTGQWWILNSSTQYLTSSGPVSWGGGDTILVPADYDGDGKTDLAVYFPSTGQWWILYSSTNYSTNSGPIQWGGGGAIPVPADYDGDGKADPAVYFPSAAQWWILYSSTGYATKSGAVVWGLPGDTPIKPNP